MPAASRTRDRMPSAPMIRRAVTLQPSSKRTSPASVVPLIDAIASGKLGDDDGGPIRERNFETRRRERGRQRLPDKPGTGDQHIAIRVWSSVHCFSRVSITWFRLV